eukprot:Platyproteum_vivax@DN6383_c0_g1_i7.p1
MHAQIAKNLVGFFPDLQELTFSRYRLQQSNRLPVLVNFLNHLPKLTKLDLWFTKFGWKHIKTFSDTIDGSVLSSLKHLNLHLSNIETYNGEGKIVAKILTKLESLEEFPFDVPFEEFLTDVLAGMPDKGCKLKKIALDRNWDGTGKWIEKLPCLKTICFAKFEEDDELSDEEVEKSESYANQVVASLATAKTLQLVDKLSFSRNSVKGKFGAKKLAELMTNYPQVKHLKFGETNPIFVDNLLDIAPTKNIESLELNCDLETMETKTERISRSVTHRKVFATMPNLKTLSMNASFINKHILEGFTPHNLLHLEVCADEKLHYIDIQEIYVNNCNARPVTKLLNLLPKLQTFKSRCTLGDFSGLKRLQTKPYLKEWTMDEEKPAPWEVVLHIFKMCPLLTVDNFHSNRESFTLRQMRCLKEELGQKNNLVFKPIVY